MSPESAQRRRALVRLIERATLTACGVLLAAWLIEGISYADEFTLFWVVLALTLFNVFLKPLLVLFALPFVILSLGLGLWLINALILWVVGQSIEGFVVADFTSALLGSALISVTSFVANLLFGSGPSARLRRSSSGSTGNGHASPRKRPPEGDIIDV